MPRSPVPARAALAALIAVASLRCGESTSPGNAARAETITASDMRRWIERLADDSMRGRATPSPEIEQAATTIAAYLRRLGLRPGFPGDRYILHYPAPPTDSTATDSAPIVAAVLPGRDPALSAQYVAFVAHLDGLGVGPEIGGDSIYNGADDNASGVAAVLEIAEAFVGTDPLPRRSLLFLLVSGEELKYWGSLWYVDHPSVPLADIAGLENLDMIGRNGRDTVRVGGRDLTTMGWTFSAALEAHPELGFTVVAPSPQSGSDFVPFWVMGVPWLHFFTGLHADFHKPSDEPSRVDADKAARVARLAFHTALMVSNADARPIWLTSPAPPAASRRDGP